MTPVELLADHQQRPRHLGKLVDADVIGEVGSIIVGDALRFYLGLDEGGRIREARFQVFGAQSMLGSTSVLCEMLPGRDPAAAVQLDAADVCAELGGLERERLPAMLWGLEAMRVAIGKAMDQRPPVDRSIDRLVCRCYGIDEASIREAIEEDGFTELEAVSSATSAGTGCGSCRPDIQAVIDRVSGRGGQAGAGSGTGASALGRIGAMKRMQQLLHVEIQPELSAQGHSLELWDWPDPDTVVLRADPALADDDRAAAALQERLQDLFRVQVQGDLQVRIEST
ncbi:MAG: iron-sulfur cluster assembly scaffold protein [Planctomycetota bacterium]